MDHPTHAVPEPGPPEIPPVPPGPPATPPDARAHDPLAVALGNASLLGVGYLLMGRRRLAVTALGITVTLGCVLVSVARTWCEVAVLPWWAIVVAHGWFLAGGRPRLAALRGRRPAAVRNRRLVALGATLAVLLSVGLLRYDGHRIGRDVTEAREDGDCAAVLAAQGRVWLGDRIADAPLAARGDRTAADCRRLRTAEAALAKGLTGDTDALDTGFDTLAAVLARPGNDRTVETALEQFLAGLPTKQPCRTVTVTDWLRHRHPSHDVLDRSAATVARTAPAALLGCGDDLMKGKDTKAARARYQQLLDQYPHDARADEARGKVRRATLTIELAHVRDLLDDAYGSRPEYCSSPAKYSGAKPYGKGTNRALFYGNDTYTDKLPAGWRTDDPAHAVLVVCAGDEKDGASVRTCPYENKLSPYFPTEVTFHKIAVPVKVYELRTGKLVADRKVQINGASCPGKLHYTTPYGLTDIGPPSDVQVKASTADVRAAFRPLIQR